MSQHDEEQLPPSISMDGVFIDPDHNPVYAKKWQAMIRKHGSPDEAFAAMLGLHQEHNVFTGDTDDVIYDLSESEIVGLRIPKALLFDIQRSAGKKGITVEKEILNRLGTELETNQTIL